MKEHEEELARVLAPLREPMAFDEPAASADALRERVLHTLRAQVADVPERIEAAQRARNLRTYLFMSAGGLALAAAALLAFLSQSPRELAEGETLPGTRTDDGRVIDGALWVSADGASHPIVQGMLVPEGSRELRAQAHTARVRTEVGAEVQLAPHTRLHVSDARDGAALRVMGGEIACSVPKLGATRSFAVDTPTARVVVHGTRFTVRVSGDGLGEQTCVRVQEGIVAVHARYGGARPVRLTAGQAWGCEDALTDAPADQRAGVRKASRGVERAAQRTNANPPRALRTGTLDAENKLLGEALGAERMQDRARAHALFGQLLERHPSSPLAAEARAGLERTR